MIGGLVQAKVNKYDPISNNYTGWAIVGKPWYENLLTNNGRDTMHQLCYISTAASIRGFGVIALSANSGSPAAGDTLLTTELSVNGMARAEAGTKTHTNGTNQSVVEHTFTANANFTDVRLSGLFDTTTTDTTTLSHEASFASVTLATSDLLKITWTLNLG